MPAFKGYWRSPPAETFSDWKIVIHTTGPEKGVVSNEYHVHRCQLAFGQRHSAYFQTLFADESKFEENKSHISEFHFAPKVAGVFPVCLDYLYDINIKLSEVTEVFELCILADYFGIDNLIVEATIAAAKYLVTGMEEADFDNVALDLPPRVLSLITKKALVYIKNSHIKPAQILMSSVENEYLTTE